MLDVERYRVDFPNYPTANHHGATAETAVERQSGPQTRCMALCMNICRAMARAYGLHLADGLVSYTLRIGRLTRRAADAIARLRSGVLHDGTVFDGRQS